MKLNKKVLATAMLSFFAVNAHAASLEDILHQSSINDIKLQILHYDYSRTLEERNEINSQYDPHLDIQGSAGATVMNESDMRDYESFINASLGMNGSLSLYDPTMRSQSSIHSYKEAIAYHNVLSYLKKQSVTVTKLYYDVLKYRDTLAVDKESYKAYKQQFDKVNDMATVGLRTQVDVAEVRAQLDAAEATLLASQTNLDSSIARLYVYTADYNLIPDSVNFEEKKLGLEDRPYDEWARQFRQNNIDLKIAKFNELMAKETINLHEESNDLRVNLTSGIGANYHNERYDDFEYSANVGINFSLPVFDGGANDSRVKQASYSYAKASTETHHLHRQLEPQLRVLHSELKSSVRSIESLKKAVESSKYSYEAIQSGYEIGTRDMLDVLNANADYAVAQKNLYTAQYDYLTKQAEFDSLVSSRISLYDEGSTVQP